MSGSYKQRINFTKIIKLHHCILCFFSHNETHIQTQKLQVIIIQYQLEKNSLKHKCGLIFTHLNVRSLWPHFDEFKLFVTENNVACIPLSESRFHSQFPDRLVYIPNYVLIRHNRQTEKPNSNDVKKGGGLVVYIKQDINIGSTALKENNVSNEDIELQCLIFRPPQQKKFVFLNVYGPPAGNLQIF